MGKARVEDVRALVRCEIRLRKFKEIDAPEEIISSAQSLLDSRIQDLTRQGFDVMAFLESDKGKVFFLEVETHDTCTEHYNQHCNICEHRGITISCIKHKDRPVICKEFKDSGKDIVERIQEAMQKCEGCPHYTQAMPDLDVYDCSLSKDAIFCKGPQDLSK